MDNPRHEALRQALEAVRRQAEQLAAALDEPLRQFTGSAVWAGQVAVRFGEELSRHRRRLREQAARVTRELEEELSRTPRETTPAARRDATGAG
ncbi:hypothetical protein MF672_003855 [Actinomadura sp. ATCC 31491]|uniref:PE domain-containing protein n=1 Tax=Actinomadura luzonensis TaxID=2805427 RepID=A0ABT0FL13_9ACTN|nr:hypothetical protein [Actinomadura luzonensis]MCK2212939.1 hypothetical protein [Actinomadura luzonensis]